MSFIYVIVNTIHSIIIFTSVSSLELFLTYDLCYLL